nr:putative inactive deoxyuridine 5'-triphosphate nucleotidohydrolase-like protein FLJ16323 [Macaca fascicularis]
MTLCFAGLEILVPKGEMLPPGDTIIIPLNWKLTLPPSYFVFLKPLTQQARKGVTMLAGMTDPDYQGEIGLLHHSGGQNTTIPSAILNLQLAECKS